MGKLDELRYRKVALISPKYEIGPNAMADHPPAGLGYLAETLELITVDYLIIDQRLGYDDKALLAKLANFKPDLIGIGMMTYLHQDTYSTIKKIKSAFPDTDIIAGGPHVSTLREAVLEQSPGLTYGAVLEGEETLKELCLGKSAAEIKGLIHRTDAGIVFNGDRPFQQLDDVAFPRFRKFELDKYRTPMIPLVTSRGCPYRCVYCPVEKAIGKRFRMREAGNVVSEIEYWRGQGRQSFLILDDNFTLKPERVFEFCDLILSADLDDLELGLPNGVRADRINRQMLAKMKAVGFSKIAFGVEAGNDKVLAEINKGEELAKIEESIKAACDLGFDVILFFLIGSPSETWEDFMDSVRLAKRYRIDDVRFYNLIPFPGTKLFEWVKANGYLIRDPGEYLNSASHFINSPCFATPEMNLDERRKAFKRGAKTARQVRRRALSRRLAYLGPFAWLVAGTYVAVRRIGFAEKAVKNVAAQVARLKVESF